MSEGKRERQRRKRAAKRKARARQDAEQAQAVARLFRAYDLADRAREHLLEGETAKALGAAARAASLVPDDPLLGSLYLEAAERSRDPLEQVRALEYLVQIGPTDPRLLARLSYQHLAAGDEERARGAVRQARAALPRRMKDRKQWLALIEYVEARLGQGVSTPLPPPARTGPDGKPDTGPSTRRGPRQPKQLRETAGPPRGSERSREAADPQRKTRKTGEAADPQRKTRKTPETADSRRKTKKTPETAAPDDRQQPAASEEPPRDQRQTQPPEPGRLEIALDVAGDVEGLELLASGTFSAPEEVALVGLAARIRDAESYDRLFALERARGLLRFSHQEETARKVLAVFLGRALLADEVGLGKTIEAGLVLSEYLLRGRVQRALVLAPPSLVAQWREELESKFEIAARTTEDAAFRRDPDRFWSGPGVVVASLPTARGPRQRELVTASPWDLVIVDEAHALKNAATESYRLASRITSRFLLLLTATPVENRIEELYNLVSLIRPGQLGRRAAFLRRFSDAKLRDSEAARAAVRALLAEVMVRNTRALSGVQLPPRFARTVLVAPDPAEAELYGHLAAALRALGPGGRTRLLLSVLLQEAGSSPLAVRATLGKVAADPDTSPEVSEALGPAIRCAERAAATGKGAALLRVLDGADGPAVVFTRFRATLDFLAGALGDAGVEYEKIDGNVPAPLRHQAIDRLRRRGGVLLSTEVGAEGLNLQFCRRIVNFDLPWNPMRIEQRIGRVHRIGQDHPVDVVNLCLAGSIEERILQILDERINLFELVVGEAEMILGYLEDEREFGDLVLEAFADPEEDRRERKFAGIADALAAARARYDNVKRFDETFFRDELGV